MRGVLSTNTIGRHRGRIVLAVAALALISLLGWLAYETQLESSVTASGVTIHERDGYRPVHPGVDPPAYVPPPRKIAPPDDLDDPAHPPQWTKPVAVPRLPSPPDPFTTPEAIVDPSRGRDDR